MSSHFASSSISSYLWLTVMVMLHGYWQLWSMHIYVVCVLWDGDALTFILSKEWIAEHHYLPGFLQQIHASMNLCLLVFVCNGEWFFRSYFQKRARGEKLSAFYSLARWASGQGYFPNSLCFYPGFQHSSCWASSCASVWFVMGWGWFCLFGFFF